MAKRTVKTMPVPMNPAEEMRRRGEAFLAEYRTLCNKYGVQIVAEPMFRRSADTGLYNIEIAMSLAPIEKRPDPPSEPPKE